MSSWHSCENTWSTKGLTDVTPDVEPKSQVSLTSLHSSPESTLAPPSQQVWKSEFQIPNIKGRISSLPSHKWSGVQVKSQAPGCLKSKCLS